MLRDQSCIISDKTYKQTDWGMLMKADVLTSQIMNVLNSVCSEWPCTRLTLMNNYR